MAELVRHLKPPTGGGIESNALRPLGGKRNCKKNHFNIDGQNFASRVSGRRQTSDTLGISMGSGKGSGDAVLSLVKCTVYRYTQVLDVYMIIWFTVDVLISCFLLEERRERRFSRRSSAPVSSFLYFFTAVITTKRASL